MGRQLGHVGAVKPKIGQGHCHVGFAAAKGGLHLIVLEKAVIAIRSQPQHDLTKGNNFRHDLFPLSCFTDILDKQSRIGLDVALHQATAGAHGHRTGPNPVTGILSGNTAGGHDLHVG